MGSDQLNRGVRLRNFRFCVVSRPSMTVPLAWFAISRSRVMVSPRVRMNLWRRT